MKLKRQTVYTPEEIAAFRRELLVIGAVRDLLDATQVQHPHLSEWVEKWRSEADGVQASFEFFLSGEADPMGWRFAAWIDYPKGLLDEVTKIVAFLLEEEPSTEKDEHEKPEPTPEKRPVAVSLWGEG